MDDGTGQPEKIAADRASRRPGTYVVAGQDVAARALPPGLYLVATPIGNLGDITLRALETLAAADLIACEDTRVTARLLDRYGIRTPLTPYHDHNAQAARPKILARIRDGGAVALVSDAGTPLISDPGYRLVCAAQDAGAAVTAIPGASAVLTALGVAGLPTDRFLFAGFPPPKSAARRTFLEELAPIRATLVFFEGGSRLAASLADMAAVLGAAREAVVCRELTKLYETLYRGPLAELAADPRLDAPKGEIVILVGPGHEAEASAGDIDTALADALSRLRPAEAAAEVAKALGLSRRDVYQRAMALRAGK